ncbi:hypothetical protein [Hoeflea sp.]|uniref:hypothetical protein n=1 Tax=Hoeflea sp. TaxID=1940281 RepID=UPI003B519E7A
MSEHDRASQGRLARFCGRAKLWLDLLRPKGHRLIADEGLDDRMKRDIGIADGPFDPAARPDPRGDHYRRLMRHGRPLA